LCPRPVSRRRWCKQGAHRRVMTTLFVLRSGAHIRRERACDFALSRRLTLRRNRKPVSLRSRSWGVVIHEGFFLNYIMLWRSLDRHDPCIDGFPRGCFYSCLRGRPHTRLLTRTPPVGCSKHMNFLTLPKKFPRCISVAAASPVSRARMPMPLLRSKTPRAG